MSEPEPSSDPQSGATPEALPGVFIKKRRARPFLAGHPWVFSGSIERVAGDPQTGAEVRVLTHDGKPVGRGLYNAESNIRVRIYLAEREAGDDRSAPAFDPAAEQLSAELFRSRLESAIDARRRLFDLSDEGVGCRLVFSEADGLSGLTVDKYGPDLLVVLTSEALHRRIDSLIADLNALLTPRSIRLRTEKGLREQEGLTVRDGLLTGEDVSEPFQLVENGIAFEVDVREGQKTGFYLDQRANRRRLREYIERDAQMDTPRVLDLFCYSGGFAMNACAAGAREVLGVDVSDRAVELADANAARNGYGDQFWTKRGKAFDVLDELAEQGERFDVIVCDPPKMTRHRSGLAGALRGYQRLNSVAASLLNPGGLLVTCSCSGLVPRADFLDLLRDAVRPVRRFQILEVCGADADHPLDPAIPETDYLTCVFARVF